MADFVYNRLKHRVMSTDINLSTDNLRWMLTTSSYVGNADDDFVDEAGANDPIDHELSGTGYVAGHGNSGRQALASITFAVDEPNDRGEMDCADVTWTSITAGTAAKVLVEIQGTIDDTDAQLCLHIDSGGFPITTNGGDLTIQVNAEGLLHAT